MKAYKVFNPDWTCNGFQYEVGRTYEMKEEPILCNRGFHACKKVQDCFSYYSFDPKNKVAEVELMGVILGEDNDKQVCNKIKIVKEITWEEMLVLANTGKSNSGLSNSGDWNSGHRNSGLRNSGHWNSGDWNTGCFNSITPEQIFVFNKPCKRKVWDNTEKPYFIFFELTKWIQFCDMTEEEKKNNPQAEVTGGYLKTLDYKEAWAEAYRNANKKDILLLKALPNFDAKVFEEITGIDVNQ